ncbi:MAG: ABC transporter ATP-binding protein [Fimbriimonas sp.]
MRSPRSPGNHDEDLKKKLTWGSVRRLVGLAKPHWKVLLASGVLSLIGGGLQLALPILVRNSANDVQRTGDIGALDRIALGLLVLLLASAFVGYFQFILSAGAGNRIVADLRKRLIGHLQRLPVAYFDRNRSGDLTALLSNDASQLQTTVTEDLVRFPSHIFTAVGLIAACVWMNAQLSLVVVGVLAAMMIFFVVTGRALRLINRKALDAVGETMGAVTEILANIRLVKAFSRERHEDERAGERLDEVFRQVMRGARWEGMMATVGSVGAMLMIVGVMWYGARGVIAGQFGAGDIGGFIVAVMFLSGPMGSLASLYTRLQRATGAADRIFAILDEATEPPDAPDALPFPAGAGEVAFERVEFSYVPGTPVLTGLTLRLSAGKVTAVVGPSGAGKTTLSALVYRFYEPQAGTIRIDGVPVDGIRRHELREHVGIVPQEPILFNGTLRENIRYGRLDATDEDVYRAARDANVEEFVGNLPDGYETVLGERGITLSGGQRQRVAIARALLKDPRILILDEATSALDTKSEALVKDALDRLMQGRTTLIIAHRLSTVQNADQIAVLAEGKVVETGTHDELLRRGGRYAELYEPAGA